MIFHKSFPSLTRHTLASASEREGPMEQEERQRGREKAARKKEARDKIDRLRTHCRVSMIMRTDGCRGMQPHRCLESASARDHDQSDPGSRWASAIPMSLLPSFASSASPLFRSRRRATIRWHTDGFDTDDAAVADGSHLAHSNHSRFVVHSYPRSADALKQNSPEVQTRENGGKRNRNETPDRSNHGVHTGTTASGSAPGTDAQWIFGGKEKRIGNGTFFARTFHVESKLSLFRERVEFHWAPVLRRNMGSEPFPDRIRRTRRTPAATATDRGHPRTID